jgi:hypothetical protein
MQTIDEQRLEADPQYRYEYLAEFIGFGPDDVALIQRSAQHLGPRIPQLVEQTYQKLLTSEHPQIRFRKDHLNRYFMQLIGRAFDQKMVLYLDMVGKIHTPKAGNDQIDVPLVQMNALMGVISDVLLTSISDWPLEPAVALQTIRAFNKLLWIQNDFINRHYQS